MLTDKLQMKPDIIEKTSADNSDSQIGNALLTGEEIVDTDTDEYQGHIQQGKNTFFFRDPSDLADSEKKEINQHNKTDDMTGKS